MKRFITLPAILIAAVLLTTTACTKEEQVAPAAAVQAKPDYALQIQASANAADADRGHGTPPTIPVLQN